MNKKIVYGTILGLIVLSFSAFVLTSGPSMDNGMSTHYPEQGMLDTFTTITIDGKYGEVPDHSQLKITEAEFNDLALNVCSEVLKTSDKFSDVSIDHAIQNLSFKKNPLNMGITFFFGKKGLVNPKRSGVEINYRFTRSPINPNDPISDIKNAIDSPYTGRIQPGQIQIFDLADSKEAQREQMIIYLKKRCEILREEMEPNLKKAKVEEEIILKKIMP